MDSPYTILDSEAPTDKILSKQDLRDKRLLNSIENLNIVLWVIASLLAFVAIIGFLIFCGIAIIIIFSNIFYSKSNKGIESLNELLVIGNRAIQNLQLEEVMMRSLPQTLEGRTELSRDIQEGYQSFSRMMTKLDKMDAAPVTYSLMKMAYDVGVHEKTPDTLDAISNIFTWGGDHIDSGNFDAALDLSGKVMKAGLIVFNDTETSVFENPAIQPIIRDTATLVATAANFTSSPRASEMVERLYMNVDYATSGHRGPEAVDDIERIRKSAVNIIEDFEKKNYMSKIDPIMDLVKQATTVASSYETMIHGGIGLKPL
jgi:uncharacterized protein YjgD (DUF1641 family)